MVNERSRLPNGALVKVPTNKPLSRRCSKAFFVATVQREIHGDRLHRTELPPSLQGFFYGHGRGRRGSTNQDVDLMRPQEFQQFATHARAGAGEEEVYDDEEEDDEEYMLPPQEFGRFASIVGRTLATPTMDTSFAFLSKVVHRTEHIFLLNSCNGLVLFGLLRDADDYITQEVGYIVCNPATKQWVRVPSCSWIDDDPSTVTITEHTSLLFDPAVSSHFQLILFWDHDDIDARITRTTTHSYSSETRLWRHSAANWIEERQQGSLESWRFREISQNSMLSGFLTAFVDGMVFLILGRKLILQVDPQGNTRCIIPAPPLLHVGADNNYVLFLGQSQGILHCIVEEGHVEDVPPDVPSYCRRWKSCGLSVWVLQNSDTPKWVLKHQMSNLELFGKKSCEGMVNYHVITVHPDCNVIFFLQHREAQMVSYDMDRQEARVLRSFKNEYGSITPNNCITLTPYAPYLSELFVGVAGAHK